MRQVDCLSTKQLCSAVGTGSQNVDLGPIRQMHMEMSGNAISVPKHVEVVSDRLPLDLVQDLKVLKLVCWINQGLQQRSANVKIPRELANVKPVAQ